MLYKVAGDNLEVPVERVHAGLLVYDTWLQGLHGRTITREERLAKVGEIAAQLAPRQYIEKGQLMVDYYAPTRLRRVLLSELSKRRKPTAPRAVGQLTLFKT